MYYTESNYGDYGDAYEGYEYNYYESPYSNYDYNDAYESYEYRSYTPTTTIKPSDLTGPVLAIFGVFFIIVFAIAILSIVAQWKIFKKANKPGWASIVPFYNNWVLFEVGGLEGALSLICLVFPPFMLYGMYKLCKAFGKSTGFFVASIFFSPICLAIIAFGKSQYLGPQGDGISSGPAPAPSQPTVASTVPTTPPSTPSAAPTEPTPPAEPQSPQENQ